jgi:hypothetical protein
MSFIIFRNRLKSGQQPLPWLYCRGYHSTLAIQGSTLCRPAKSGQVLS